MRPTAIIGVISVAGMLGCAEPTAKEMTPLVLPACYRLSYADWGEPPVTDAEALRGFRAPILIQLLDEAVPRSYTGIADSAARGLLWVREVADTVAIPGTWSSLAGDTLALNFAGHPGLFGIGGFVLRQGDSLVGSLRTYTDVIGLDQGMSGVIGRPLPCAMPRRWSDPFDPGPDSGAPPRTVR
jgi:hypothetical protein